MAATYQLTKEEKETIILYNQTNKRIIISGYDVSACLTYILEKRPSAN